MDDNPGASVSHTPHKSDQACLIELVNSVAEYNCSASVFGRGERCAAGDGRWSPRGGPETYFSSSVQPFGVNLPEKWSPIPALKEPCGL